MNHDSSDSVVKSNVEEIFTQDVYVHSCIYLPLVAQYRRSASSRNSPGGSLPQVCFLRQSYQRSAGNSFGFYLGLCSDMHCQLWDLAKTVCTAPNPVQVDPYEGCSVEAGCTRA
ncbi:hypothetical protein ILYODFUR_016056 [Ilyodon furcidens]|uniref:Uncharacterized protein n=1 Tax=Ilyodon furcidens TaxID=33524 RepID=A0ABV0T8D3_9TELE